MSRRGGLDIEAHRPAAASISITCSAKADEAESPRVRNLGASVVSAGEGLFQTPRQRVSVGDMGAERRDP